MTFLCEEALYLVFFIPCVSNTELSMGWVVLVWVGLGRDFSVFGGLGWVNYSKSTKNLKGFRAGFLSCC